MRKFTAADACFMGLCLFVMYYYAWVMDWRIFHRAILPFAFLPFSSSYVYELIMLGAAGLVSAAVFGARRAAGMVLALGSLEELIWGTTYTLVIYPKPSVVPQYAFGVPLTTLYPALMAAALALAFWLLRGMAWRVTPLFFAFLLYYFLYFAVLRAPMYALTYDPSVSPLWELAYEFLMNLAVLSGWYWRK